MSNHYINNKDLFEHLKIRSAENAKRIAEGMEKLPVDRYLGEVIMAISSRLSYMPRFINYSYKSEMISDAIETCLKGIDNFDCSKYSNPFGYLTQVAFNAFVKRIKLEKKQQNIKCALICEMPLDELFSTQEHDEDGVQYSHHIMSYLTENNFAHTPSVAIKDVKLPTNVATEFNPLFD